MTVQGTQKTRPAALEFQKDTVYVRSNVRAVATADFTGWEYEEKQYTYPEYVELQQTESDNVKLALAELAEMIVKEG